ncbi:SRPBCC domain-containing protein [Micromonospora sp. FIMYZ51]|uniref:SRPBCC family protein n=1 Tax=Micromonospora sp. FIMYZ51 TaxID=3051832 RepID=UPI00311DEA51
MDDVQPVAAADPVRVDVVLSATVAQVWVALTDGARLAAWFGTPRGPWVPGSTWRVEFGDGDFFQVTPRHVVPDRRIEFDWSFLGVGPVQRVVWEVTPIADRTRVTVQDADPARSPAELHQMRAGWTDFLQRLSGHLRTGRPTRYDWREEIDGAVDIAAGWAPLHLDVVYRWLPVASDGFRPSWFFVIDDDGPRRFEVVNWRPDGARIEFGVRIPGAVRTTVAELSVETLADRQRLRFSHRGWRGLGLSDVRARALRSRFAATWTEALEQARQLGRSIVAEH